MLAVLVLTGLAALAALAFKSPEKCPVTGAQLSDAQLADPSLRVGDKVMCCKNCVKQYAANPGAYPA
jgi:hypothetical protein